MPAYFVLVRDRITNPAELEIYQKEGAGSAAGHKMTPRVVYGPHIHLEGKPAQGLVILEFPTVAEAEAWYRSPAYQKAVVHRHKGADDNAYIVEGF